MRPCPKCASHLANQLDYLEFGESIHESSDCDSTNDVHELIDLARQLRDLPRPQPDRVWLRASKRALLGRFDELHRSTEEAREPPS